MEVVIGVILLVGAFALGHHAADEKAQAGAQLESEQAAVATDKGSVLQRCRYRASGPAQRDLTVPYSQQRQVTTSDPDATRVAYRSD